MVPFQSRTDGEPGDFLPQRGYSEQLSDRLVVESELAEPELVGVDAVVAAIDRRDNESYDLLGLGVDRSRRHHPTHVLGQRR